MTIVRDLTAFAVLLFLISTVVVIL
jgi:hypothetical protein